jgi:membrane protein implicated in regulation of membrane protease activity
VQRRLRPWWALALACLAGLIGLAVIILAVWQLPSLLYGDVSQASPDARLQAASGFRTALVAGLAGLAALGSLAMASRTYRLTQQGQITDRYTKAIEQLGGDKLDVRLGGIYALERIAMDSERDHPTVVEVLSAFVREHSQPSTSDDDKGGEPTTDVLAAVTVLGRLPQRRQVSRGNLEGAYLESAELEDAHLERANLRGARLQGANLDWAHLEGAILQRAHLEGAYLQHAHLQGADLLGANLEGAYMGGAKLRGAHLKGANLKGAWLQWSFLEGADLKKANLEGAQLWGTKLSGANLDGAQLQGATYDADTVWPAGFDWKAAGVLEES